MKRQSVEDYAKERFEMEKTENNYDDLYENKEQENNKHDLVNHPSHYETGKFECIEVMENCFIGGNSTIVGGGENWP